MSIRPSGCGPMATSARLSRTPTRFGPRTASRKPGASQSRGGSRPSVRVEKDAVEAALRAQAPQGEAHDADQVAEALERVPNLSEALAAAPPKLKRQVFEAERLIEISATVSEAVATAFQNAKDLQKEVPCVTTNGIAGARYVSPSDAFRIVERRRWPVAKAA